MDNQRIVSLQKLLPAADANSMLLAPVFIARILVNYFKGVNLSEVSTENVVVRWPRGRYALLAPRPDLGRSLQTLAVINVIYSSWRSTALSIVPLSF